MTHVHVLFITKDAESPRSNSKSFQSELDELFQKDANCVIQVTLADTKIGEQK